MTGANSMYRAPALVLTRHSQNRQLSSCSIRPALIYKKMNGYYFFVKKKDEQLAKLCGLEWWI